MPKRLSHHCLVSLDGEAGTFFLTGGYELDLQDETSQTKTYILKEGNWIEKEDMPTGRWGKKPNLEMQRWKWEEC